MLLEFDAQRSDLSHLIVAVISNNASSTVVKFLKLIQQRFIAIFPNYTTVYEVGLYQGIVDVTY